MILVCLTGSGLGSTTYTGNYLGMTVSATITVHDPAAIDDTGLPVWSYVDDLSVPSFNCKIVVCPDPAKIITDPGVLAAAASFVTATRSDSLQRERGAFVFMNANGTLRVGPTIVGVAGEMPNMTPAPDSAVCIDTFSLPR